MKTFKVIFIFGIILLNLLSLNTIYAGSQGVYNVELGTFGFRGSLGTARNSIDTIQDIGCEHDSNGLAFCYAADSTGAFRSCSTTSPALIEKIRAIKGDSYIKVGFASGAQCTYIFVSNFSSFSPK